MHHADHARDEIRPSNHRRQRRDAEQRARRALDPIELDCTLPQFG
jgi:hypothetical protein